MEHELEGAIETLQIQLYKFRGKEAELNQKENRLAELEQALGIKEERQIEFEKELRSREQAVAVREKSLQNIREQLSMARVQVKAAQEREEKQAKLLQECRTARLADQSQLAKIKQAFPALFAPPAPVKDKEGA